MDMTDEELGMLAFFDESVNRAPRLEELWLANKGPDAVNQTAIFQDEDKVPHVPRVQEA